MKIVCFQNQQACIRSRVCNTLKFRLELAKREVLAFFRKFRGISKFHAWPMKKSSYLNLVLIHWYPADQIQTCGYTTLNCRITAFQISRHVDLTWLFQAQNLIDSVNLDKIKFNICHVLIVFFINTCFDQKAWRQEDFEFLDIYQIFHYLESRKVKTSSELSPLNSGRLVEKWAPWNITLRFIVSFSCFNHHQGGFDGLDFFIHKYSYHCGKGSQILKYLNRRFIIMWTSHMGCLSCPPDHRCSIKNSYLVEATNMREV